MLTAQYLANMTTNRKSLVANRNDQVTDELKITLKGQGHDPRYV